MQRRGSAPDCEKKGETCQWEQFVWMRGNESSHRTASIFLLSQRRGPSKWAGKGTKGERVLKTVKMFGTAVGMGKVTSHSRRVLADRVRPAL